MSRGDCRASNGGRCGPFFRRKLSNDLVRVHPDNISNNDWAILLEAGTIIGPTPQRIRVARWMQEKKTVKKYDMFLRTKYFIVVELPSKRESLPPPGQHLLNRPSQRAEAS